LKTLVIQSCCSEDIPVWIEQCLASVKSWCKHQGHAWRFIDDEIFELVPDWYIEKTGKGPVATDYARLVGIHKILKNEDFEQVIWLDADVYILDKSMVLECRKSCAFGHEVWVQKDGNGFKARKNVHNAVCLFKPCCVVLPFLIETVASIIQRADIEKIAPQMVGPKLLSALHSLYDFDMLPQVGAISPEVALDIRSGEGPALRLLLEKTGGALQAVNLCASLITDDEALAVIAGIKLLQRGA